jgi:DNA-binding MarR family transcriptional regulator
MANLSRMFLVRLHHNLAHLDIDRSFYPLMLIEAGNGSLTQNDLAKKLSCSKVQVVRIIDYLSSLGYVERCQNEGDRRKISLEITGKAAKYLPDIKAAVQETMDQALRNIPGEKVDELYGLLGQIDRNLSTPLKKVSVK